MTVILYTENSKDSKHTQTISVINKFIKVIGYKINMQNY